MQDAAEAPVSGQVVEFERNGRTVRLCVANPADVIQKHHAGGVFYEEEELAIIATRFPVGGVFFDIGANIGNHALYAALYLGASGVIVAEPMPAAYELLRTNVALNGLESVIDTSKVGVGLSDRRGAGQVARTAENNLGATRLRAASAEGTLQLETGDAFLAGRSVDFIKLDVEGMELQVLAGLSETIARCRPPMFIEVEEHNADAFETRLADLDYVRVDTFKRYRSNFNAMVVPRERV